MLQLNIVLVSVVNLIEFFTKAVVFFFNAFITIGDEVKMMHLANISSFDLEKDDFIEYIERFENYLLANDIKDAEIQKAVFLSTVGGSAYKLIRSLCENDTKNKTFTQIIMLMRNHLKPTPNFIAQRFQFYKRDRKEAESINEYIMELRRLSEHCEFSEKLNDYLRDRFVCGLNNENVQQKLINYKKFNIGDSTRHSKSI